MVHLPSFYHPDHIGTLYVPDTSAVISEGQAHKLSPSGEDRTRIILLLVDPQVDFIHLDGALSVPGAVDDTRRTVEWIYRHIGEITAIATSLDTHIPTQIFFPGWWINEAGEHPAPFTPITCEEVDRGYWKPLFESRWSLNYVHVLEMDAKKQLMIWPYHTMLGTPGHTITPSLYEAIAYHSAVRQSSPTFLTKGMIAKTEHYSIFEPEVKVPEHPQGDMNTSFLELLDSYDLVYVAGQAKSHCVLETITSVMLHFQKQPEKLAKWRILMDCTSSVAHPEIDFDTMAENVFARYAERGLRLVRSTDPLG